jgi:putative FmdB family regulatory protein
MPTYVYECSSCDKQFEVEQRITEEPLTSCACGSSGTVKRLIQPIAVMFKGAGFHINDYSAAKGESPAKAEDPAPSETPTPGPECTGQPATCGACPPAQE